MQADQEELLKAAIAADRIALQQLLISHCSQLEDAIRLQIPPALRSTVEVDDILQLTFVEVLKEPLKFKSGNLRAFVAWMNSIAKARVKDEIRKARTKKRGGNWQRKEAANTSGSMLNLILDLSAQGRSPSQSAAAHQATAALQVALASLPDDQHEAVWLRHIECLTIEEVALETNKSEAAVRGLIHRGKAALKKAMGNSSAWLSLD